MENQGESIRVKCVQKLNKAGEGNRRPPTNVCAFLDAILDVNIVDKLKIIVPYQSNFQSYSQLFSIIAHRCPKLKSLSMGFYNASSPNTLVYRLQHSNLSQLAHRLNCLETLDLWHIHDPPCRCTDYAHFSTISDASILAVVAEFCPVLINLTVKGFYITDKDLLSLITGASFQNLFLSPNDRWRINFSTIHSLVVPAELVSPLCFTLKNLQLNRWWHYCDCNPKVGDTSAAFALKHLPELKTSTIHRISSTQIIQLLYSKRGDGTTKSDDQKTFEEFCRQLTGIRRNPLHPPLSGCLGLSEVKPLMILNADFLRAIGYMCPHLDRFIFNEKSMHPIRHSDDADQEDIYDPSIQLVAPEELESILSTWPKLERLSLLNFKSFSARTMKILLDAFSSSLTVLELKNCSQISLTHLSVCTQLQQLHVSNSFFYSDASFDADKFLPSLKHFQSNVCLGEFAHLFERKSTLIDAEFNCCHTGTSAHSNPDVEWSEVPKLLPLLKALRMGQATGLTMDVVSNLASKMPKIALIEVPQSITLEQIADHTRKITQDGRERKQLPVIRHFQKSLEPCLYQRT